MIMANKKNDVDTPVDDLPTEQSEQTTKSNQICSCTKISTMQLFHEMKQRFPTVPDTVVCEYVEQNCHNPAACIDGLEKYPNSAKVYPQALRNQQTKKHLNRNLTTKGLANGLQNKKRTQKMGAAIDKSGNSTSLSAELNQTSPQRPNTLNLTNLNSCTRPINRPTRAAPPPPNTPQKSNQQPLNLSLNVIVSPVSNGQPMRPPRSQQSTSVSFTLHQPNSSKTVTIPVDKQSNSNLPVNLNETGPSLEYTSCAYDAEIGYQSRLQITVEGTSPMNDDTNLFNEHLYEDITPVINSNCIDGKSIANAMLPSVSASPQFIEESDKVHHQMLCRQRLVLEMDKERKRLEKMQRENVIIQQAIPNDAIDVITKEVEELRNDCNRMAQELEESAPAYPLGDANGSFYTGQSIQQRQQLRPHRKAPSPDFHALYNSNQIPNLQSAQRPPHPNEPNTREDQSGWECNLCTFRNKVRQRECEACAMPFLSAGNAMGYNGSYMQSSPPSYPLTQYVPMPMHSLPYQQQNNMPLHYLMYQPASLQPMQQSQSSIVPNPQYFNGFQTMAAYQNP